MQAAHATTALYLSAPGNTHDKFGYSQILTWKFMKRRYVRNTYWLNCFLFRNSLALLVLFEFCDCVETAS